jgi:WD40 repeat protein
MNKMKVLLSSICIAIGTLLCLENVNAQSHVRWTAMGHDSPLTGMEYAPNGQYFITCALEDPHVIVWDGVTGKFLYYFDINDYAISLAISPDSKSIVVGTGQSLFIHDVGSRTFRVVTDSTTRNIEALTFAKSGDTLAWVSSASIYNGSLTVIYDLRDGSKRVYTTPRKLANGVQDFVLRRPHGHTVAISSDFKMAAFASDTATFLYSLSTDRLIGIYPLRYQPFSNTDAVAFFHGSDSLLAVSQDSTGKHEALGVYSTSSGKLVRQMPFGFLPFSQVPYVGKDTIIRVRGNIAALVPISTWDTSKTIPLISTGFNYNGPELRVAFSPDRRYTLETDPLWFTGIPEDYFSGYPAKIIRLRTGDTASKQTINGVDHFISAAKFSPTGKSIAIASNALSLLDRNGALIHYEDTACGGVAFNRDGTLLACTSYDDRDMNGKGFTEIRSSADYHIEHESYGKYGYQEGEPYSPIQFNPTGHAVAIGPTIYDFDTSGSPLYTLWPNGQYFSCFSSTGDTLFCSDTAGYFAFDGHTRQFLGHGYSRFPHCTSLVLSHDGKKLLYAADNGWLELINAADNTSIKYFGAHPGFISAARFSADDRLIISSGSDSTIKFWDAKTYALLATIKGLDRFTGVEIADDGKDLLGITRNALIDYDSLPAGLAVASTKSMAEGFSLDQNYPNPFHDHSTIDYAVPSPTHVSIRFVDELGRTFGDIFNGNVQAGKHSMTLSRKMLPVEQGVFYYEMTTRFGTKARMIQVW